MMAAAAFPETVSQDSFLNSLSAVALDAEMDTGEYGPMTTSSSETEPESSSLRFHPKLETSRSKGPAVLVHHMEEGALASDIRKKIKNGLNSKNSKKPFSLPLYGEVQSTPVYGCIEEICASFQLIILLWTPKFQGDKRYLKISKTIKSSPDLSDIIVVICGFTGNEKPDERNIALQDTLPVYYSDTEYFQEDMVNRLLKTCSGHSASAKRQESKRAWKRRKASLKNAAAAAPAPAPAPAAAENIKEQPIHRRAQSDPLAKPTADIEQTCGLSLPCDVQADDVSQSLHVHNVRSNPSGRSSLSASSQNMPGVHEHQQDTPEKSPDAGLLKTDPPLERAMTSGASNRDNQEPKGRDDKNNDSEKENDDEVDSKCSPAMKHAEEQTVRSMDGKSMSSLSFQPTNDATKVTIMSPEGPETDVTKPLARAEKDTECKQRVQGSQGRTESGHIAKQEIDPQSNDPGDEIQPEEPDKKAEEEPEIDSEEDGQNEQEKEQKKEPEEVPARELAKEPGGEHEDSSEEEPEKELGKELEKDPEKDKSEKYAEKEEPEEPARELAKELGGEHKDSSEEKPEKELGKELKKDPKKDESEKNAEKEEPEEDPEQCTKTQSERDIAGVETRSEKVQPDVEIYEKQCERNVKPPLKAHAEKCRSGVKTPEPSSERQAPAAAAREMLLGTTADTVAQNMQADRANMRIPNDFTVPVSHPSESHDPTMHQPLSTETSSDLDASMDVESGLKLEKEPQPPNIQHSSVMDNNTAVENEPEPSREPQPPTTESVPDKDNVKVVENGQKPSKRSQDPQSKHPSHKPVPSTETVSDKGIVKVVENGQKPSKESQAPQSNQPCHELVPSHASDDDYASPKTSDQQRRNPLHMRRETEIMPDETLAETNHLAREDSTEDEATERKCPVDLQTDEETTDNEINDLKSDIREQTYSKQFTGVDTDNISQLGSQRTTFSIREDLRRPHQYELFSPPDSSEEAGSGDSLPFSDEKLTFVDSDYSNASAFEVDMTGGVISKCTTERYQRSGLDGNQTGCERSLPTRRVESDESMLSQIASSTGFQVLNSMLAEGSSHEIHPESPAFPGKDDDRQAFKPVQGPTHTASPFSWQEDDVQGFKTLRGPTTLVQAESRINGGNGFSYKEPVQESQAPEKLPSAFEPHVTNHKTFVRTYSCDGQTVSVLSQSTMTTSSSPTNPAPPVTPNTVVINVAKSDQLHIGIGGDRVSIIQTPGATGRDDEPGARGTDGKPAVQPDSNNRFSTSASSNSLEITTTARGRTTQDLTGDDLREDFEEIHPRRTSKKSRILHLFCCGLRKRKKTKKRDRL